MVRGIALFLTIPVLKSVRIIWTTRCVGVCDASNHLDDSMRLGFLCGAAISRPSARLMLHFSWSPKVLVLWSNHLVWER